VADAKTFVFRPGGGMVTKQFNAELQAACLDPDSPVTEIEAAVVDGSLFVTLLAGVVEATDEDLEDAKEEGVKPDFKVGDFIPEGDALCVKIMHLRAHTEAQVSKVQEHLDDMYGIADGMIVKHLIVKGRGLANIVHVEDVDKKIPEEQKRRQYIETEIAFAVVIFLAEALDEDGDADADDVERTLRKPRPVSEILNAKE
jgi:translation elongation factor EF-1beta